MALQNPLVVALLRSPLHRMLSGSVDVIRYHGRRSGREFTTPTQYARYGDGVVILVGRPDTKTWWRNFRDGHDLDVLLDRTWVPMSGQAIIGADSPEEIATPLEAYLERFRSARRSLADGARSAVLVVCTPRTIEELDEPGPQGTP
jgi:hypothetical protein